MVALVLALLLCAQETPESLIESLSESDVQARTKAAARLLDLGSAAVPALKKARGHPDPEVAMHAKEILERIEAREQLTPALRALDGVELRLSRGGDRVWTEFFLEALPWKAASESAYSRLEKPDLEALVLRAIAGAKDEQQLIEVLGAAQYYRLSRGHPRAEELIADPRPAVRSSAARVLIFGSGKDAVARAESLLKHRDIGVRTAVIDALGERRLRAASPLLLTLKDEEALTFRLGRALLQTHSKEGAPLLLKLMPLPGPGRMGNSEASMCLGYYAGPEIIPQMRAQLQWMKSNPNTADGALNLLGCWGDRESIPLIEQAVRDFRVSGNNASGVAQAFYYMGATSSTATLLKLAEEGNDYAMTMLALMGNRDAVPGLRRLLAKGRARAAEALAALEDREAIPAIRKLLQDRDEWHRRAACRSLVFLGDLDSFEAIRKMPEANSLRRIWPVHPGYDQADGAALPLKVVRNSAYQDSEYQNVLMEGTNSTYGFPRYLSVRGAATMRAGRTAADLLPWLGREGDEYHGLIASAAMSRLGLKQGVPALLESERLLTALNAVRMPETWKLLESRTTSLNVYAPYEQIHRTLAKEAGLAIEGPPKGSDAHKAWTDVHQRFQKWGRPATIAEAFEMLDDDRWSIVLEKDRIRVVPHDEALLLWSEWSK